jgi:hypothetical protein
VVVHYAKGTIPYLHEGDKGVGGTDSHYVLKPTGVYVPVTIALKNLYIKRGRRALSDEGPTNGRLVHGGRVVCTADLEAPCDLDNVVFVLTLKTSNNADVLYLRGVGRLDANRISHISIDETTAAPLAHLKTEIHLFVDGREAMNSSVPSPGASPGLVGVRR